MKLFALLLISLYIATSSAIAESLPTFEQYQTTLYEGAPAADIQLANDEFAKMFRTRLRAALRAGVNFAGHYHLTYWGCGTDCIMGGIVDIKTGKVYSSEWLAPLSGVYKNEQWIDKEIEFNANSTLLIVSGNYSESMFEHNQGTFYLDFQQGEFRQQRVLVNQFIESNSQ